MDQQKECASVIHPKDEKSLLDVRIFLARPGSGIINHDTLNHCKNVVNLNG